MAIINRKDTPETSGYKPFVGRTPGSLLLADTDYLENLLSGPMGMEVRRLRRELGSNGQPVSFAVAVNEALGSLANGDESSMRPL